jgi:hypothetical protein
MLDLAYISATLVFFALLLLYVRFCARLGRTPAANASKP